MQLWGIKLRRNYLDGKFLITGKFFFSPVKSVYFSKLELISKGQLCEFLYWKRNPGKVPAISVLVKVLVIQK